MSETTTKSGVRERGIIMQAHNALAIELRVKTQTRRTVKIRRSLQPGLQWGDAHSTPVSVHGSNATVALRIPNAEGSVIAFCPYGDVGDQLWVKEAYLISHARDSVVRAGHEKFEELLADKDIWKYINPRFMPKWAARDWLEITEVRIQRVQEISETDAAAEGLLSWTKDGHLYKWSPFKVHAPSGERDPIWEWQDMPRSARDAYAKLWDEINGAGSWASNPWVWALTFKLLRSERCQEVA